MSARAMAGLRPVPANGTDRRATYCGPTALSAITNRPPERFVTWPNRRRVGMRPLEVVTALQLLCGVNTREERFPAHERLSLWRFCRPSRRGIAHIRGHWIAVDGFTVCDSITRRTTWVADHPKRNAKVVGFISVPERRAKP